jgi:hypothetical protein
MFIITGAKNYDMQAIDENSFMFTFVCSLLLPFRNAA